MENINNNISEVNPVEIETENKREWKKPMDIYLNTNSGNIIVHEATSEKSFNKLYYTTMDAFKRGDSARRIKEVKLPLNREKETFTNVHALWNHLKSNCGYKQL